MCAVYMDQLPPNVKLMSVQQKATGALKKNKGKQICESDQVDSDKCTKVSKENRLATLDIFAGCGGLSEGLQQAGMHLPSIMVFSFIINMSAIRLIFYYHLNSVGVSFTKWAIEYEEPAGEAFTKNHPEAAVFVDNCNVILK